MKRIISLLLATACVFLLVSCGGSATPIEEVVANSKPDTVKTLTTVITAEDVFHGTYLTTMNEDGFRFDYSYERYAEISDAADSYIVTVEGSVYYKNGKYSEDGENWSVVKPNVDYQTLTLDLDEDNFKDYLPNEDGTTLVATFAAENAEKVLGRQISATGDVAIIVKTNGVYLTMVSISYTSELGEVRIDTSYSYSAKAPAQE